MKESTHRLPVLSDSELSLVKSILKKHVNSQQQEIWIFGSRASGTARKNSDLDLLFSPALSLRTRGTLQEEFDESNLAFEVDLVNEEDLADVYKDLVNKVKIKLDL